MPFSRLRHHSTDASQMIPKEEHKGTALVKQLAHIVLDRNRCSAGDFLLKLPAVSSVHIVNCRQPASDCMTLRKVKDIVDYIHHMALIYGQEVHGVGHCISGGIHP